MRKGFEAGCVGVALALLVGCVEESPAPPTDIEPIALETDIGDVVIILVAQVPPPEALVEGDAERIDTRLPQHLWETAGDYVYVASAGRIAPSVSFSGEIYSPGLDVSEVPMRGFYDVFDDALLLDELPAEPGESELAMPCGCEGQACLQKWVEDNLGCGVCAVVMCGAEVSGHACYACP